MIAAFKQLFSRAPQQVPGQRRRYRRFNCVVPVRCTIGRAELPAMIVDLSRQGMRLQLRCPARLGSLVTVTFEAGMATERGLVDPTLHTRVTWFRKHGGLTEIGVVFSETEAVMQRSWVPHLLKSVSSNKSHMEPRAAVRFASKLNGLACPANSDLANAGAGLILDLSATGASFCGSPNLKVGMPIVIRIAGYRGSVTLVGQVVRRGHIFSGPAVYGIHFNAMKPAERDGLNVILADLMKEAQNRRPALFSKN
ncbi:MAG: PilZ domain-containing protein [Candidatus Xenobia bacterium]